MTSLSAEPADPTRGRLSAALRDSDGLGRLSTARLSALLSEGIHQAALGGIVLFSPEAATTPAAIAGGFAVMLLVALVIGQLTASLRAQVEVITAQQQQSLESYRKTVQTAFREVNDALVAVRFNGEAEDAYSTALNAARRALQVLGAIAALLYNLSVRFTGGLLVG